MTEMSAAEMREQGLVVQVADHEAVSEVIDGCELGPASAEDDTPADRPRRSVERS